MQALPRLVPALLVLGVGLASGLAAAQEPAEEFMLHAIRLQGEQQARFIPDPLEVPAGATVVTMNFDTAVHSVVADDGSFRVDAISPGGEPFPFAAPAKAGNYTYHCGFHPQMRGTLVVLPGAEPPADEPRGIPDAAGALALVGLALAARRR